MTRERELFLDMVPKEKYSRFVLVQGKEDIDRLYTEFFQLQDPPPLYLDCRSLSAMYFNNMLKFIEEYKGSVQLSAMDPVPAPILSRFSDITKGFEPRPGNLLALKFRNLSRSLKQKVSALFGFSLDQEEEDEENEG